MSFFPSERDAVGRYGREHDGGRRGRLEVRLDDHGGRGGARAPVHVHGVDAELAIGLGLGLGVDAELAIGWVDGGG